MEWAQATAGGWRGRCGRLDQRSGRAMVVVVRHLTGLVIDLDRGPSPLQHTPGVTGYTCSPHSLCLGSSYLLCGRGVDYKIKRFAGHHSKGRSMYYRRPAAVPWTRPGLLIDAFQAWGEGPT